VANRKTRISGPGAADFLTATGGLDRPETEASKGTSVTNDDGPLTDARALEPELDPPDPALERERTLNADVDADIDGGIEAGIDAGKGAATPPDRGGRRSG
jgi:hypothetical protein